LGIDYDHDNDTNPIGVGSEVFAPDWLGKTALRAPPRAKGGLG